ncbi:hypothetical protein [Veillonella caviae]|uniref:hypothetical protein n=1 Tax=Veillonella caviae TaxID=248316 RepID=UPI000F8CED35|nr:hypothetical protein [Veillonella caviae]
MKLTKNQIQQQREAIDGLYELVKEAPASERKDSAMAYCEGCIAACDLGLKVLNGKKTEDTPKADKNPTVEEQATAEEKPKRKRVAKKKDEPVEEKLPVDETPVVDETPEEDDLDDLL